MNKLFFLSAMVLMASFIQAQQGQQPSQMDYRETDAFSPEEVHIRAGIAILAKLCNTLARVQDARSAQAAVPIIMNLSHELHAWGQQLPSLPQRSQDVVSAYEHRYLPVIEKINGYLRVQGERLSASNYYGTQDLPAALMTLYSSVQQ